MKPIISNHKIDYTATAEALLEAIDLTIDDLVEQSHFDKFYFLVGAEFRDGEILPVSTEIADANTTFINAEVLLRVGAGSNCNCEVCEALKHQEDSNEQNEFLYPEYVQGFDFMDFYKKNFEDALFDQRQEIMDKLEQALRDFLLVETDLIINNNDNSLGETHVGTEAQFVEAIKSCFMETILARYENYLVYGAGCDEDEENILSLEDFIEAEADGIMNELPQATREDTFLYPNLD